jgi:hypothetical protein
MTPRTAALAATLAAAALAVAGCSGSGSPSSAAPQSPTLPTASSLNSPRPNGTAAPGAPAGSAGSAAPGASADNRGGGSAGSGRGGSDDTTVTATSADGLPKPNDNNGVGALPASFPLPPGTTTGRIAVRSSDITAPLLVTDGTAAAAYWRTQLPASGYTISLARVTDGLGEIRFTGKGCVTGSELQISGEHVAFLCTRG